MCDNQKCLQTFQMFPGGQKHTLVENHGLRVMVEGKEGRIGLRIYLGNRARELKPAVELGVRC